VRAASPEIALGRYLASPQLATRLEGIERAAVTDAPLLFLGEPGTGRTSLARAVHAASRRAGGPLVEVEPGAIPPALFESELFGHRPGAFTGAETAYAGRVERAAGGTLLLDHVEEMPLAVQPKLLRILAEHRYRPLGGDERTADVRFLAVGSDELPFRVEQGAFRADLYYRLEVLAFRLPALRERLDDLATITESLVRELAGRLDREPPPLTDDARAWMLEHSWPGNLRELRNVLERNLVITSPGEPLNPAPPTAVTDRRPRSLRAVEHDEIIKALAYTQGHQGRAAELLGISRKALWEKRKRLGIP